MYATKLNQRGSSLIETVIGVLLLGFCVSAGMSLVTLNARTVKIQEIDLSTSDIALARISEIEHAPFRAISTDPNEYPNEQFTIVDSLGSESFAEGEGLYYRTTEVTSTNFDEFEHRPYSPKIVSVRVHRAHIRPNGKVVLPDTADLENAPYRGVVSETMIFHNTNFPGGRGM